MASAGSSARGDRVPRVHATARQKSRLRLVVVQAIVLSLFVTLFARLWYLQVLGGEAYQAQAAEQSVRELVVQPARGLIVDDMGRPLVANRTSWVITVDRTMLKKMDDDAQEDLLHRVARIVGSSYDKVRERTLLCGEPGSMEGTCWNGSPYQPVPVAEDVPQRVAVSVLEQSEDFPAVLAESTSVRAYPSPFGINAAHLLGYLSPITEEELDEAEVEGDTSVHGASVVGRAGVEKEYDKYLRGVPGYKRVAVDSMGRVLGDSGRVQGRAGDTLVTSIDARVQSVVERQLHSTIKLARQTVDPVTGRRYVADSGAAVVMDATNGRIVAMAGYPTYDPGVWVGGAAGSFPPRRRAPAMRRDARRPCPTGPGARPASPSARPTRPAAARPLPSSTPNRRQPSSSPMNWNPISRVSSASVEVRSRSHSAPSASRAPGLSTGTGLSAHGANGRSPLVSTSASGNPCGSAKGRTFSLKRRSSGRTSTSARARRSRQYGQAAGGRSESDLDREAHAEPGGRHIGPREKSQIGAGRTLLVGVEEMIGVRHVLVDRFLDQAQAQHADVKVEVFLRVTGDRGDVVYAMNRRLHRTSPNAESTFLLYVKLF